MQKVDDIIANTKSRDYTAEKRSRQKNSVLRLKLAHLSCKKYSIDSIAESQICCIMTFKFIKIAGIYIMQNAMVWGRKWPLGKNEDNGKRN